MYQSFAQGTTSYCEDEVLWRKDGSSFHVAYTSVPMRKGDAVVGAVVVFRDITERKKAEEALREREYRLKTILTTSNEGFWGIDNDARTMAVNPAMCAILGRSQEEILGRTVFEFLDEENLAIMREQLKRRATGETGAYEVAISRPDGCKCLVCSTHTAFYDKDGSKIGSFAMVTDITERKKMEAGAHRGAGQGGSRHASQERLSGQHEPRDPHAHERHPGHDASGAQDRSDAEAAETTSTRSTFPPTPCWASSTTFWTFPRSRPGSWTWSPSASTWMKSWTTWPLW